MVTRGATATMTHTAPSAFRASPDGRTLSGWAVRYGVVDDYLTMFTRGMWDASLAASLPVLCWSHDWSRPLGRIVDADDRAAGLFITARFDDPADVPDARQAIAQVKSGTMTMFSVGFIPEGGHAITVDGKDVGVFTRGRLDEVSLVMKGAVPGADVTDLRRPRHAVTSDPRLELQAREAYDLARRRGGPTLADEADEAYAVALLHSRGIR